MNPTLKQILSILSAAFLVTSCNKAAPAGFWTDFHKESIAAKNNDQGPWGGLREITWKSQTTKFTDQELIAFAGKNHWKLVDSISFSADSSTGIRLSNLKNDAYSADILNQNILPKLKTNDRKLFVFKTTWLSVEPGNTRETFENGFAVLNADKTELKVFHLWGE